MQRKKRSASFVSAVDNLTSLTEEELSAIAQRPERLKEFARQLAEELRYCVVVVGNKQDHYNNWK